MSRNTTAYLRGWIFPVLSAVLVFAMGTGVLCGGRIAALSMLGLPTLFFATWWYERRAWHRPEKLRSQMPHLARRGNRLAGSGAGSRRDPLARGGISGLLLGLIGLPLLALLASPAGEWVERQPIPVQAAIIALPAAIVILVLTRAAQKRLYHLFHAP
jgi:hypothetical protein